MFDYYYNIFIDNSQLQGVAAGAQQLSLTDLQPLVEGSTPQDPPGTLSDP